MQPVDPLTVEQVELLATHWNVHPQLAYLIAGLWFRCKREGFTIRLICGFRSHEEQRRLYAQGRTTPGPRVTNAKPGQSRHNSDPAEAADFTYPAERTADFGRIAQSLGLEWGGAWKTFKDNPHVQLRRRL